MASLLIDPSKKKSKYQSAIDVVKKENEELKKKREQQPKEKDYSKSDYADALRAIDSEKEEETSRIKTNQIAPSAYPQTADNTLRLMRMLEEQEAKKSTLSASKNIPLENSPFGKRNPQIELPTYAHNDFLPNSPAAKAARQKAANESAMTTGVVNDPVLSRGEYLASMASAGLDTSLESTKATIGSAFDKATTFVASLLGMKQGDEYNKYQFADSVLKGRALGSKYPTLTSFENAAKNGVETSTSTIDKANAASKKAELERLKDYAKNNSSQATLKKIQERYSDKEIGEVAQLLGNFAYSAGYGALSNAARIASPAAAAALMGTQEFSESYARAINELGYSDSQALEYAAHTALRRGGEELILGQFGKGIADKAIAKPLSKIANPYARAAADVGITAAGEAGEQALDYLADIATRSWVGDENAKVDPKELGYQGVLGGATSLVFGLASYPGKVRLYKQDYNFVNNLSKAAEKVKNKQEADTIKKVADIAIDRANVIIDDPNYPRDYKASVNHIKDAAEDIKDIVENFQEAITYEFEEKDGAFTIIMDNDNSDTVKTDVQVLANVVAKYAEPDENIVNKTVDTIRDKIQDIKHEQELTTNPDEKAELQKQIEKLKEADVVVRSNRDEIEAKAEESKKNANANNANTAAKSETEIEPAKSDTAASKEVNNEKPATDISNNQSTPLKKTLEIIRLAKENDAKSLSELVKSVNESEHGKNGDNAINNTVDYVNEFIQKLSENLKTAQNKDAVEYINTALPQLKNISESLRTKRNEIDAYLNGDGTSKATNQSAGAKLPEDSLAEATDDVERTKAEHGNQQLTSSDSNAIIENEQTQPETQTTSKVEAYKQKLRDAQTRGEFRSVEEILGNPDSDIHYSDLTDADRDEIYKISDEKQIEFNRKEYEAQNAESRTLVDNAVRSIKDGKFDNKGITNDALAFYDENGNKRETHIVNQLMKDFGIEVPLATQGWFNKRLISFRYENGASVVRADLKGANGRTLKVPDNVYNYLDILGNKIRESSPDTNNSNAESAATVPAANNEVPETTPAQTATAAEQNIAKEPEPNATPSAPAETAETSTTAAESPTTVTSDGTAETAPAKNKDFYLIYKASKHSKTGEPLDVFEISGGYLSSEQYSKLKNEFEKLGGYYSKYAGGFTFKSGTGSSDERINAVKQFAHVQVNSLHDMPKGKELIGTEYKFGNSNAKVVDYIDNGKYEDEYVVEIDGIGRQKMNYKGVERDIAQYLSDNPTKNTQATDTAASTEQTLDMLKNAPSETTTRETTEKEIKNNGINLEKENRPDVQGLRPEVEETAPQGEGVRETSGRNGGKSGGDGTRLPRVADGDTNAGKSVRNGEPDISAKSDTGTDERNDSEGHDVGGDITDVDTSGRKPVSEKQSAKKPVNFSFDTETRKYINTTRPKTADNIEAIKTLFQIEKENRPATAAEKNVLAKYKGWGGLADAFANYSINRELKEMLSEEEYNAAKRSTQNAHYTSLDVIEAMYKGLEHMGFTGGNLLEPSMGTGNFFGMLPKDIAKKTKLYGVEMDSITGRIAQVLYSDADIKIAPYQDVRYNDGSFDVAVGNVPFSSTTYPYKGEKHMLHDYFFVKTLDKVKDGGIVMFITSTGTLDKANPKTRDAIAKQADLVAAFRLPNNAFKTNAGTEVTTDIVVLRKRPKGVSQSDETFFSLGEIDGIPINEYFVRHPENILGKLVSEKGMYVSERTQVRADDRDYSKALTEAMNSLPADIIKTDMTKSEVKIENDTQKSRFIDSDKGVVFYNSSTGEVTELSGKKADKAKQFMRVKDAYNGVINISNNPNSTQEERQAARQNLEETYNAFTEKYGSLNSRGAKSDLRGDAEYWMVSGLEKKGKSLGEFEKSDIFTKDLYKKQVPEHVDSAHDALAVSISTHGTVDLDYMSKLTGQSREVVTSELSDAIIETPDEGWQLTALYLSGNIRDKIATAEKAAKSDSKFTRNVEMLKATLPRQLTADEITPKLGAAWIEPSYYEDFAYSVFGRKPKLSYDTTTGTWVGEIIPYAYSPKYGAEAMKLLVPTMNQKQLTVRVDGKVDLQATEQQRQRQAMLREEFNGWIFATPERRKALEDKFNTLFASWRGADFNKVGEYLSLEGVNPEIKLREYQKGAVARVVFGGDTLLAHGVGTGKTFEMIASAMESKRLGITHKNLFVVPNNKVSDFQSDIHKLYPSAKVMAVGEADFTKDRRAAMISALATNDYDIAVIGHSQFGFIPVSNETKQNALRAQIAEIENTVSGMNSYQDRRTVKQLEKAKESLENKLKELSTRKDDTINFESLGVDGLFVDEAHNFKSLTYYTKLNVAGANAGGASQRAQDMFEKTQYLHDIHGRVVFGTATPITNSVAEIYNMTRFVNPEILKEAGIESFDAWSANFGNIESKVEISPDGISFRAKERYSKFSNVNAMIGMFRRFADVLRSDEVLKDLPKAKRVTVECESNDYLEKYLGEIQSRVDALKGSATKKDNMLLVTNDGRAAAIDLRLIAKQIGVSPSELDLDGSKINKTVENVVEEYKNSAKQKGTQLVFLDYGMSDDQEKRYGVDLYSDLIKKLTSKGIPSNEIVRLDKVDNKNLEELYKKVNNGDVRVLIGSTARMGEGLNVQKRLVALHHLNPPYRPSDIEQREGRIIRFGNENKDVRIYRYVQKRSFDSYMWQMLERKQVMINQAMSGGDINELDDVDEFVLSAAEAKALASGNPLLLEKSELDDKFSKLSTARSVYLRSVYNAQDVIASYPAHIQNTKRNIDNVQETAKIINSNPFKGDFEIELKGKKYTERKAANEALAKILADGRYGMNKTYEIGTIRGLKLSFMQEGQTIRLYLDGADRTQIEAGSNNIARIVNAIDKASNPETQISSMQSHVEQLEKTLSDAKDLVKSKFPQQEEYDATLARLNEVNALMNEAAGVIAGGEIIDDEGMGDDFDDVGETGSKKSKDSAESQILQSKTKGKWGKGDKDGNKLKSLNDLKEEAHRMFGVEINTGKIGGRGAEGIYNTHAGTIRTRVHGDLPTIAHELGHHFDKKYNLVSMDGVEELVDYFRDELEEADYNESLFPYEAVAYYFADLMRNQKETAERFKTFTSELGAALKGSDAKHLPEYINMTNEYFAADRIRRREAQIHYRHKDNSFLGNAQFQVDTFRRNPAAYTGRLSRKFIRDWFDDVIDLKNFGRAHDLAFKERAANSIISGRLNIAFTDNNGAVIGKSLANVLEEGGINDLNAKSFDAYLTARIALDRIEAAEKNNSIGSKVYADTELQNKDNLISDIQTYELKNPTFADTAKGVYEYENHLLDVAVDSGLISSDLSETLRELYPHYVPLYRSMRDSSGASSGRGDKTPNSVVKRFKGSGRDVNSPIENIMYQTAGWTKAILQNETRKEVFDYIDSNEDMGIWAEKVPASKFRDTVNTDEIAKKIAQFDSDKIKNLSADDRAELIEDIMKTIGSSTGMWKKSQYQGKNVVSVMRNGQPEYYEIHDDGLMDALTSLTPKQMGIGMRIFSAATNLFTSLTTGTNPRFGYTNLLRDEKTGYIYSETRNNPFAYTLDLFKAFGEAVMESPDYKSYLANGGGYTGAFTMNMSNLKHEYRNVVKSSNQLKRALQSALGFVPHVIDSVESASRYAEYKRTLKEGANALDALRASQNITVNFQQGGKYSKTINKFIPFFNASMTSLYQNVDRLTNGVKRLLIKWLAVNVGMAIINIAYNEFSKHILSDDDDPDEAYSRLSAYNKFANWNFYIGDGQFFRIPKDRALMLPSTLIMAIYEKYVQENPDAFYKYGEYIIESILPPGPRDMTIFGSWLDIAKNETFTGAPIESKADRYKSRETRYDGKTSKFAIKAAQVLPLSPKQIDYLIDDNTGWVGDFVINLTKSEGTSLKEVADLTDTSKKSFLKGLPVPSVMMRDSVYSNDILNKFYDTSTKYSQNASSYKALLKTGGLKENSKYTFYDTYGKYKYDKITSLCNSVLNIIKADTNSDSSRQTRWLLNTLIKSVNETEATQLDKDVAALAEETGYSLQEIAPYIVVPESLKDSAKNVYALDANDMMNYYTESQILLEYWYKEALSSGYDDKSVAGALEELKKEIKQAMDERYLAILQQ
jgi:N12 class adenine-specific DNA methylase